MVILLFCHICNS